MTGKNSPCPQLPSAARKGPSGDAGIAAFSYTTLVSKAIHSYKALSSPACFVHKGYLVCSSTISWGAQIQGDGASPALFGEHDGSVPCLLVRSFSTFLWDISQSSSRVQIPGKGSSRQIHPWSHCLRQG